MLCNDARLRALLTVDESSGLFRDVSKHVETCPRCRERLLELSGDESLVLEACETLRGEGDATDVDSGLSSSVLVAIDSLQGGDVPIDFETVSLDFLAPASHPEMLGRLGRYEIEKVIGTGGMGVVLKAYDTELHRVVAVKVLLPHLANSGAARRRFSREAQAAAAVVHEHVIPIYNVEAEGDIPYLVMQYVPGQSLQARVDEHGPLGVAEVLRIARQAAAGLAAAHDQGVVHRDVKPANLLLEDSVDRVLISDFGLARTVDDATLTRTGIVAGTPHYMSPEQAGGEVVDHRTDLFSLGSVLYFMCTGRPPFRADSPMAVLNRICHEPHRPVDEVNPLIPLELAELIERLLAMPAAARFASARDVEQQAARLLTALQQGGRLRRRGLWRRWSRVARRGREAARLFLLGGLCLLLGIGVSRWMGTPVPEAAPQPPPAGSAPIAARSPEPIPEAAVPDSTNWAAVRALLEQDTFDADLRTAQQQLDQAERPDDAATDQGTDHDPWELELQAVESLLENLSPLRKPPDPQRANSNPAVPDAGAQPQAN